MDSAIWGLLGTLVGAGVSIGTSFIGVWKESRLQEKQCIFEREEKARTFQRENILKIQELLHKSISHMSKVHFSDLRAYKETGVWGQNILNQDLNKDILINNKELVIIEERISNDELRKEINDFRSYVSSGMLLLQDSSRTPMLRLK